MKSETPDRAAIADAVRSLEEKLAIADSRLAAHAFLAGNDFTLADIQFGHALFRYYDIEIERAHLPNLQAYYRRLTERPAFRTHVMVSYKELRTESPDIT